VLTAPFLTVQPTMDLLPMVKAFAIVIVGGLGSIPGSILASLLVGYSETIVGYSISPAWTEIVSLIAVLLTLIVRPAGILGKRAVF
jgi:branched-chain amino acid transport system permease protein